MTAGEREVFEERAAICEFDGLLTREEAEKQGLLASEQYREACEIREILAMPTADRRKAYLDDCEKKRGKVSADRLRQKVREAWAKRRG